MNDVIYNVSLDMYETQSQCMLAVKKSDNGRRINFVLTEGGRPYAISEGCSAVLRAKKPDGTVLFNNCVIDGNVISYTLTNQTSASAGIVDCELMLSGSDGKQITSPRFSLRVEDTLYSEDEIESTDEFTELQKAIAKAESLVVDVSNKVDKVAGKGLSTNDYTDSAKSLLEETVPQELDRIDAKITEVEGNVYSNFKNKVDKVAGKGLSTNDFTNEDKAEVAKVAGKVDKPTNIIEGLLGFNFAGVETIKGITGAGVSVEIDPSQIPNNRALKEYVAAKNVNFLSKPTSNGIVGYMSGIGSLTYTLNTSMPENPSHAEILSAKAIYDYINSLDASGVNY